MIAAVILVVAVSAMALLAAVMLTRGRQSKYMNMAGTLASEKLEDLNRWSMNAEQVCVQPGDTSEGSLAAPVNKSISCAGETAVNINYFDDISIDFVNATGCGNASNGCFAETVTNVGSSGTTYYTTYHSPSGTIPTNPDGSSNPISSTTAPANMTFHRTWLIEANTPLSGARRITVLVTLTDQSVQPPVSFQMSLVRQ
jgi:hypothetical protein